MWDAPGFEAVSPPTGITRVKVPFRFDQDDADLAVETPESDTSGDDQPDTDDR